MDFLSTFLVIAGFVGLSVLFMNIGYIFKKREFRGSCSSNNPMLSDKFGSCSVCGKKAEEACKMPDEDARRLRAEGA
ncbi:MAG: hypothetical protein RI973_928 [Bacteroidota bacterium]